MNFSFLGALGSVLPNYIQGQRQAIQDNWTDLMNYNKAQQGQLENAFLETTFGPRLDMFYNSAFDKDIQSTMNGMNFMRFIPQWQAGFVDDMYRRNYAPTFSAYKYGHLMNQWQNPLGAAQMMMGQQSPSRMRG